MVMTGRELPALHARTGLFLGHSFRSDRRAKNTAHRSDLNKSERQVRQTSNLCTTQFEGRSESSPTSDPETMSGPQVAESINKVAEADSGAARPTKKFLPGSSRQTNQIE